MQEVEVIGCGEDVRIGVGRMDAEVPRGERRAREREAVGRVLEAMLGRHVAVGHREDGAPMVEGVEWLSITHSQRIVAVAISEKGPVGIDAEEWRPALERVKTRFLSEDEMQWCDDLLLAWTIKEAVYKAASVRLLTGPEIHIARDYQTATARGVTYRLTSWRQDATRITIAKGVSCKL